MKPVLKAYDAAIAGLAVVAGLVVAAVFLSIVYDVTLRTLGFQPPYWTSGMVEYALMAMTMLAAPWVVRMRGHVFVESLTLTMPPPVRRVLANLVYLACIAICFVLAYYATVMGLDAWRRGELDIRSVTFPRWVLYGFLTLGMFLCGTEFLRYLLGRDSMYTGRGADTEGL